MALFSYLSKYCFWKPMKKSLTLDSGRQRFHLIYVTVMIVTGVTVVILYGFILKVSLLILQSQPARITEYFDFHVSLFTPF